ncbi:NADP-dependent oxidoreductase [Mesorhizobium sp. M7A.F.Ca.US.006.04.2.1]|uniref:NADP-dependent oxidoreductase n=1 Tax=unclassified Mesorhizobium TaxID=325217 RepID=UPI000FCAB676|nr:MULTISPECIES: NADP-dependent oxidoreductase [unclassified Mesorhizobium]RUX78634.1 NADP-dependent oxidoreductase [Mesorhizobium sp. M7A.F.Ca.US.005.03.1.1]RUY15998.1 NADP-dependent oxidoreductase [Mesorhizobium sp. M7A.F.Ca.US.005.03.2.1]RUY27757.1 NADP-dependent oxidoreductase [Mesorhizobium sp. M7A.F.Ca.US.001.04.2.1]RUY45640.1 NADP-dependent oxidoreductase [Mesorhizobium sp. M7A.F.Ca.US.001.04.1.1]RVA04312.1 NADP-dependent oxidoreductase [Mesorhizobium sp. M7A.F.Ca.US.001.02.1.1]
MSIQSNTRIVLAARPQGRPKPDDFRIETVDVVQPGEGELLLQILYLSLDPYMRGRMNATKSYARPVDVDGVMEGGTVARVVISRHPEFTEGDIVLSHSGWQSFALSDGVGLRKLDPAAAPITTALGVLGMPGFTAYAGLLTIGQPKPGETVVVAAASGAVGSAVGQIARIKGARAVGIAGGADKCAFVRDELGFDAVVDHRADDFAEQLKAACPGGIDIYFENVGGPVWDAVFPLLNEFARVPVCGLIAQYNVIADAGVDRLPVLMQQVLYRSLTIRGFIQREFVDQRPAFYREMAEWISSGRVRYREDIVDGIENAPQAFLGLLDGKNFGKLIVRIAE